MRNISLEFRVGIQIKMTLSSGASSFPHVQKGKSPVPSNMELESLEWQKL